MGLEIVNVTGRFKKVAYTGFMIESAILAFVVLGMVFGKRIYFCSDMSGYFSLLWFIWLLFCRFDHFGQVCTTASDFPNLRMAGAVS